MSTTKLIFNNPCRFNTAKGKHRSLTVETHGSGVRVATHVDDRDGGLTYVSVFLDLEATAGLTQVLADASRRGPAVPSDSLRNALHDMATLLDRGAMTVDVAVVWLRRLAN